MLTVLSPSQFFTVSNALVALKESPNASDLFTLKATALRVSKTLFALTQPCYQSLRAWDRM